MGRGGNGGLFIVFSMKKTAVRRSCGKTSAFDAGALACVKEPCNRDGQHGEADEKVKCGDHIAL